MYRLVSSAYCCRESPESNTMVLIGEIVTYKVKREVVLGHSLEVRHWNTPFRTTRTDQHQETGIGL